MKVCVLDNSNNDNKNLSIELVEEPSNVGDNELLIKHTSIGINYDDIMYKNGVYTIPEELGKKPILGFEGVGEVIRKGSNVKSFTIGDRVGYGFSNFGAYSEMRVIDYRYCFAIPSDLQTDIVCGTLRKGLTAEYLLFKTANLRKNDTILIHSIAGGVGSIMVKWAKTLGLKVIGTVGSDEKMSIAMNTGCDMVINRARDDIFDKVAEFTNYQGVKVVYDGIGKSVFDVSKHCLSPFGLYVSYGYTSGKIPPLDIMTLQENSLFFTAPRLENYKSNRYELLCSISTIFEQIRQQTIIPNITKYNFENIPQAHNDLESKTTTGSLIVNVY